MMSRRHCPSRKKRSSQPLTRYLQTLNLKWWITRTSPHLGAPQVKHAPGTVQVLRLRAELACGGAPRPVLPAAVSKYAPPDGHALPAGAVSRLRTAGHPVAAQQVWGACTDAPWLHPIVQSRRKPLTQPCAPQVATWQRSGQQRRVGGVADPYAHVAEEVGCGRRAEMFSFAAASLLDLGLPERIALLLTRSTLGRLEVRVPGLAPTGCESHKKHLVQLIPVHVAVRVGGAAAAPAGAEDEGGHGAGCGREAMRRDPFIIDPDMEAGHCTVSSST